MVTDVSCKSICDVVCRPRENEQARNELERAVEMFWESGLPSPRVT